MHANMRANMRSDVMRGNRSSAFGALHLRTNYLELTTHARTRCSYCRQAGRQADVAECGWMQLQRNAMGAKYTPYLPHRTDWLFAAMGTNRGDFSINLILGRCSEGICCGCCCGKSCGENCVRAGLTPRCVRKRGSIGKTRA